MTCLLIAFLDMSVTKLDAKKSNCEIITPSGLALTLETLRQGMPL